MLLEWIAPVAGTVITGGFGVWIAKITVDVRRQVTPSNGVKTADHIETVAFDVAMIKTEQVAQRRALEAHTASDQENFEELRVLIKGDGTDRPSK